MHRFQDLNYIDAQTFYIRYVFILYPGFLPVPPLSAAGVASVLA